MIASGVKARERNRCCRSRADLDRKAALTRLLRDTEAGILLNEHVVGEALFEHACRLGHRREHHYLGYIAEAEEILRRAAQFARERSSIRQALQPIPDGYRPVIAAWFTALPSSRLSIGT